MQERPSAPLTAAALLTLVQLVAERLAESRDLSEVLAALESSMREALGATAVSVGVVNDAGSALVTLQAFGFSERANLMLSSPVPLAGRVPATSVLRDGKPLFWSTLEQRDREYPEYADFPSEHESWAVLPLVVHGTAIGVISLGWSEPRRFSRADAALLKLVAQQCAVAVDRARLQEVERSERETLELLGEGTRLMVSALNPDQVVRRLVLLAVPRLAPWCGVYVADKRTLRRVAIEIADSARLFEEQPRERTVSADSDTPLAVTYRTGQTRVVSTSSREMVPYIYTERQISQQAASDPAWTALLVPVRAAGRVIGVMSLVSDSWAGAPPKQVRQSAEGLAGRAGVALANARRFERERLTATLLTEALVPTEIPRICGFEATARYLPSAGAHVAGDWFDLVQVASGKYLIGVGDAAGHGIHAASLMAQLRNAARGLAVGGHPPSRILHGLGMLTTQDDPESFATAIYGMLEPTDGTFTWAAAGHIPPIMYGPEGARLLDGADVPPLGFPLPDPPVEFVVQLKPGEGLVLITDGVVERRGKDLAERLEALRVLVERNALEAVDDLARRAVDSFCKDPDDDCCLVVLKRSIDLPTEGTV